MNKKICSGCGATKELTEFGKTRTWYRTKCKACLNVQRKTSNPESLKKTARNKNKWEAAKRRLYRDWAIYNDCKFSDKKKGFVNDLDREFIQQLIGSGCVYCGDTELKITLDRKNNALPHNKDNVAPACIRCNYMRGSMPYIAWMEIVPILKDIRSRGLFGDWLTTPLNLRHAKLPGRLPPNPNFKSRVIGPTMITVKCLECGTYTEKVAGYVKHNLKKGYRGPFCGKSCAGKHAYKNR